MGVPIGVSFGDFVALVGIINDIYKCVAAVPGLRNEIGILFRHYDDLASSMQTVYNTYANNAVAVDQDVADRLQRHLHDCSAHVQQFHTEVKSIMDRPKDTLLRSKLKSIGRRAAFASKRQQVFRTLNESFRRDVEAFKMEIVAMSTDRMTALVQSSHSTTQNLDNLVRMLGSMPKDLGYTWEGGELKRHITLTQASGVVQTLPLEHCQTPHRFQQLLLVDTAYPGRRRIERGHFNVFDDTSGRVIDVERWQEQVGPGSKLSISVAVGTMKYANLCNRVCPRCWNFEVEDYKYSGWLECVKCCLVFERISLDRWGFGMRPIDAQEWDWPSSESQDQADDDTISETSENTEGLEPGGKKPDQQTTKHILDDREECLKRITLVYSPLWNFVFRSAVCRCRLGGDKSPFTVDIDVTVFAPCRLHMFDPVSSELTKPDEGYDPTDDPYFDQFGGHLAFAAYACGHAVVQRSLDLRKLLPMGRLEEAYESLTEVLRDESKRTALLEWNKTLSEDYFRWRDEYKEKQSEWVAKKREQYALVQVPRKRRGSR